MGKFIQHAACEACGSNDNLGIYQKDTDDYSVMYDATCFGCGATFDHPELIDQGILDENGKLAVEAARSSSTPDPEWIAKRIKEIKNKPFKGMPKRRITAGTLKVYGVRCEYDEEIDERLGYHFPSYRNDELVGFKYKPIERNEDGKYDYRVVGSYSVDDQLFGQHAFPAGGHTLVITTGQEDAMAFYEALYENCGGKYETAVVSINNGDRSVKKQFQANYKYISSFDKVVLAFDNDENAAPMVEVACRMLRPGLAHIAKFNRYKDACEYKKRGLDKNLISTFFNAERYSPVEIESLGSLWSEFANMQDDEIIDLPPEMETLIEMMNGGPAKGEVTVIGALTSIGKSTLINRIAYYASIVMGYKTGLMYLESSGKEIVRSFLSMYSKRNLAVQKIEGTELAQLKREFDSMINDDSKVMIVNHHGAFRSIEDMTDKLRWMAQAGECEMIVVDPLQAAVPSNSNELIDEFMDAMLKLAKETNVHILVVSHMKKPEGKDPHDVDEYSLKGSSSINQIAFNTILMSRDKVNPDPKVKHSTKLTLVKCRRTGVTGDAGWLGYNPETVELFERPNPYDEVSGADEYGEDYDTGPINSHGANEAYDDMPPPWFDD